jgi:transposase
MSKYSNELKLEVVKYYLEENHSYLECCKKFNIPSMTPIRQWVDKYRMHGTYGLVKQFKSSYDGFFKQNVVEYMHNNHLSAIETACHFNLGNHSVVLKWERIYYEEGPQGLYQERRGKSKKMSSNKQNNKKLDKKIEEDLIAENQRLRMENEYLKKLNALVQERIKRENKKK